MGFINTLLTTITWPKGMWEFFIKVFYDGITNYAWAIVVLTIVLKLIMSPLDFMQRRVAMKNTKMQAMLAPELAKLQKQYGANKQILNQKQMELYKKNNYNIFGSCIIMLVNMILTLVIFITFYNGLRNISYFKAQEQYNILKETYISQIITDKNVDEVTAEELVTKINELQQTEEGQALIQQTNKSVIDKYDDIKDSWLWIKNIWRSDTQISVIASFDEYVRDAQIKFESDEEKELAKQEYEIIMNPLKDSFSGGNGYYIMTILVVGVSFLSQWLMRISMKQKKNKNQPEQAMPGMGKAMMFILPVIMAIFSLTSNAAFSIYIFTSSLITTALTPLVMLIVRKLDEKEEKKRQEKIQVSYKR